MNNTSRQHKQPRAIAFAIRGFLFLSLIMLVGVALLPLLPSEALAQVTTTHNQRRDAWLARDGADDDGDYYGSAQYGRPFILSWMQKGLFDNPNSSEPSHVNLATEIMGTATHEGLIERENYSGTRAGMSILRAFVQYPSAVQDPRCVDPQGSGESCYDAIRKRLNNKINNDSGIVSRSGVLGQSAAVQPQRTTVSFIYALLTNPSETFDLNYSGYSGTWTANNCFGCSGNTYTWGDTGINTVQFARDLLYHNMDNNWIPNGNDEYDGHYPDMILVSMLGIIDMVPTSDPMWNRAKMMMDFQMLEQLGEVSGYQKGGAYGRIYRRTYLENREMTRYLNPLIGTSNGRDASREGDAHMTTYRVPNVIHDIIDITDEPDNYWHIQRERNRIANQEPNTGKYTYVTPHYTMGFVESLTPRWSLTVNASGLNDPDPEIFRVWLDNQEDSADINSCGGIPIVTGGCQSIKLGRSPYIQYRNVGFVPGGNSTHFHVAKGANQFDQGENNLNNPASTFAGDYTLSSGWNYFKEGKVMIAINNSTNFGAIEVGIEGVDYLNFGEFQGAPRAVGSSSFTTGKGDVIASGVTGGTFNGVPIHNYPNDRMEIEYGYGNTVSGRLVDWNNRVMTVTNSDRSLSCTYDYNNWTTSGGSGCASPAYAPPSGTTCQTQGNACDAITPCCGGLSCQPPTAISGTCQPVTTPPPGPPPPTPPGPPPPPGGGPSGPCAAQGGMLGIGGDHIPDLTSDGCVNGSDLSILIGQWGDINILKTSPPPPVPPGGTPPTTPPTTPPGTPPTTPPGPTPPPAPPPPGASGDWNHDYPRLAHQHFGEAPPEWYAKHDLIVVKQLDSADNAAIKAVDPSTKTVYSISITAFDNAKLDQLCSAGWPSVTDDWAARNSLGVAAQAPNWKFKLANITDGSPVNSFGERYNQYVPKCLTDHARTSGYDGVGSDWAWTLLPSAIGDIDLDNSCSVNGGSAPSPNCNDYIELDGISNSYGRPDGASNVSLEWRKGLVTFMTNWRAHIDATWGTSVPLWLNSGLLHENSDGFFNTFETSLDLSNGLEYEKIPGHSNFNFEWGKYETWVNSGRKPQTWISDIRPNPNDDPASLADGGHTKNYYQLMREMLGFTLMGDGYFEFQPHEAGEHYYYSYYDEFDVPLGFPTSNANRLSSDVMVRFFDNGAAVMHPNDSPLTVFDSNVTTRQNASEVDIASATGYAGPYYRFQGNQDPAYNNGQPFDRINFKGHGFRYNCKGPDTSTRGNSCTVATQAADCGTQNTCGPARIVGDGIVLTTQPWTVISDVIVDNDNDISSPGSPGAALSGAGWTKSGNTGLGSAWGQKQAAWQDVYAYETSASSGAQAKFSPTINVPGDYEISEWHGTNTTVSNLCTNVGVTVNGATQPALNQSTNHGTWNSLGTFSLSAGSNSVVLINPGGCTMIADAVKFDFIGGGGPVVTPPPGGDTTAPVVNDFSVTQGSAIIDWTVSDNQGGLGLKEVRINRFTGTCSQAQAQAWVGANVDTVVIDGTSPGPDNHTGNHIQFPPDNTYCYTIEAVDHADNIGVQPSTPGPVEIALSSTTPPGPGPSDTTVQVGNGNYPNLTVDSSNGDIHLAYGVGTGLQYVVYDAGLSQKKVNQLIPGTNKVGTAHLDFEDQQLGRGDCRNVLPTPTLPCVQVGSGGLEIELDSNNRPHIAVWNNWTSTSLDTSMAVYYIRNTSGTSWSSLARVSKPIMNPAPVSLMGMGIQSNDNVHIVYYHNDDGTPTVATYRNGTKTQSLQPSPTFTSEASNTNSAIATNDGVWWALKYRERPGQDYYPHLAKVTGTNGSGTGGTISGTLYSGTERIDSNASFTNLGDHTGLATDTSGNYHAVWTWGHNGGDIWYAKRTNGSWGNKQLVAGGGNNDYANIAVTDNGTIVVTYMTLSNDRLQYKVSTNGGSSWSSARVVDNQTNNPNWINHSDPGPIVANGNDVYIAYWSETTGTNDGNVYVRRISNPVASAPSSLVIEEHPGVLERIRAFFSSHRFFSRLFRLAILEHTRT